MSGVSIIDGRTDEELHLLVICEDCMIEQLSVTNIKNVSFLFNNSILQDVHLDGLTLTGSNVPFIHAIDVFVMGDDPLNLTVHDCAITGVTQPLFQWESNIPLLLDLQGLYLFLHSSLLQLTII